jgi:hypothetical protein
MTILKMIEILQMILGLRTNFEKRPACWVKQMRSRGVRSVGSQGRWNVGFQEIKETQEVSLLRLFSPFLPYRVRLSQ